MPDAWVPTPDADITGDAWDTFAASLDVVALEGERFRAPGPDERPGSRADLEMRHAHEWVVADHHRAAYLRERNRERALRDAERFVDDVTRARALGRPYPTAPISVVLAAHRAESGQHDQRRSA